MGSRSLELLTLTFIFFMLQVKTWRAEPLLLGFYSRPLFLGCWLRLAGPPKIDKNFFKELDFIVSTSRGSLAQRLE